MGCVLKATTKAAKRWFGCRDELTEHPIHTFDEFLKTAQTYGMTEEIVRKALEEHRRALRRDYFRRRRAA